MRRPRHNGVLRLQLESACRANGCSQSALTVLSTRVDPYRLDTPANHRDATWLAEQLERSFGSKNTHRRGLHYSLVMRKRPVKKPDGTAFENTEEDWIWLTETAGKAAQWLGYIPFERIIDKRGAPPIIHRKPRVIPAGWTDAGLDIEFPDDIGPYPLARRCDAAGITELTFNDLRGTAVTRLALVGCTEARIAYLHRDIELARSAITKLEMGYARKTG
jgi:hypothetical protein